MVLFGAPQLSLLEIAILAGYLERRRVHSANALVVTTSPEIKFAADRLGLAHQIEAAGRFVAAGICFYQAMRKTGAELRIDPDKAWSRSSIAIELEYCAPHSQCCQLRHRIVRLKVAYAGANTLFQPRKQRALEPRAPRLHDSRPSLRLRRRRELHGILLDTENARCVLYRELIAIR